MLGTPILGVIVFGTSAWVAPYCCSPSGLESALSSGASDLASAVCEHRLPCGSWTIIFGIVAVVLIYPFDSIVTHALVVGIWVIVLGTTESISGINM
jgi:hypothetical protein